ncbi:MAG: GtrA family protein [Solirubrobacteraceae bacterium]
MREDSTAATVDLSVADLPQGASAMATAGSPGEESPDRARLAAWSNAHIRLLHGMKRPDNWLQLVRFSIVGASGYVINLLIFALLDQVLGVEYHVAFALAWFGGGINNFLLNLHWTFKAREGQMHFQALRFFLVSLLAFAVAELVLTFFVEVAGTSKVLGYIAALVAATPLNFLGNKLWIFKVHGDRGRSVSVEE